MSRKKDMDRKVRRTSGATGSQRKHPAAAAGGADGLASDGYARPGKITKATRMKFLSSGGGKRSPDTAPRDPQEPVCDAAPANETQLERKRRLNRNNERKKRAKRILKIEDLTARYHFLTSENEALKAESKELKEKIEKVKKYMEEQGKKPAAVVSTGRQTSEGAAEGRVLGSSPHSTTLDSSHTSNNTILGGPTGEPTPLISALSAALTANAQQPGQSNTSANIDLSFIPREQRVRLLQLEFQRQENIIHQLRRHADPAIAPAARVAAAPAPTPTPTPATQPTRQVVINEQEQIQALIRQATSALCQVTPPPAATPAAAWTAAAPALAAAAPPVAAPAVATPAAAASAPAATPNLFLQIQERLAPQIQSPSSITTSFSSSVTSSDQEAMNNLRFQQQLLQAMEVIQNLQRRGTDGV